MSDNFVFFNELFQMFQFFEIASKDLMAPQVGVKVLRIEATFVGLEIILYYFPRVLLEINDAVNECERIEIDTGFA
jgi:hypothetical protein